MTRLCNTKKYAVSFHLQKIIMNFLKCKYNSLATNSIHNSKYWHMATICNSPHHRILTLLKYNYGKYQRHTGSTFYTPRAYRYDRNRNIGQKYGRCLRKSSGHVLRYTIYHSRTSIPRKSGDHIMYWYNSNIIHCITIDRRCTMIGRTTYQWCIWKLTYTSKSTCWQCRGYPVR